LFGDRTSKIFDVVALIEVRLAGRQAFGAH